MAKESTNRKKAIEELLSNGWVLSVPTRARFGSSNTYWIEDGEKQRKGTDDLFSIFDLIAWKGNQILLLQYTSHAEVGRRVKKINEFIKKHKVIIPKGVKVEVWGYTNGKGFTKKIKI